MGVFAIGSCLLGTELEFAMSRGRDEGVRPKVITDGRLRPGHLESIRLLGFPGKGVAHVSFFPTAICEDECVARTGGAGRTDARGAARFWVRVPGTFIDQRRHSVYFRNGERIDVEVTWDGKNRSFAVGSADPDPIIVRSHGSHHG
ncbi:MAG TPA: hypothetical protein VFJ57_10205 [Solirubrobacterales bacterium]|nr:hypothetical protein [Solirubrobacterales bacterium]